MTCIICASPVDGLPITQLELAAYCIIALVLVVALVARYLQNWRLSRSSMRRLARQHLAAVNKHYGANTCD